MRFFSKLQSRFQRNKVRAARSGINLSRMNDLESKMGYRFSDLNLLDLALTHPSFNTKEAGKPSNQRLEFLGDSILGAVLSSELYALYPNEKEGDLSRKKSFFARGSKLAELGKSLGLEKVIKMSPSERKNNGHFRASTLEDAVEALVGAVYLDGGFEQAKACILFWLGDLKAALENKETSLNPKGKLQELIQSRDNKEKILYRLLHQKGPDHEKTFTVEVLIAGKKIAEGKGHSKKEAESEAAERAIEIFSRKK